jgi:hypothetical protein
LFAHTNQEWGRGLNINISKEITTQKTTSMVLVFNSFYRLRDTTNMKHKLPWLMVVGAEFNTDRLKLSQEYVLDDKKEKYVFVENAFSPLVVDPHNPKAWFSVTWFLKRKTWDEFLFVDPSDPNRTWLCVPGRPQWEQTGDFDQMEQTFIAAREPNDVDNETLN